MVVMSPKLHQSNLTQEGREGALIPVYLKPPAEKKKRGERKTFTVAAPEKKKNTKTPIYCSATVHE